MASKETDYVFLLASYRQEGNRIFDEGYVLMKMENGVKAPRFGESLDGSFTKQQKDDFEALLKKVQSPGFRS